MHYTLEDRLSDEAIRRVIDIVIDDLPSELAALIRQEHVQAMRMRARLAIRAEESDRDWYKERRERLDWLEHYFEQRLEELESRISEAQEKNSSRLEQVMREQLAEVQGTIRDSVVPCRFQSDSAAGDYTQLITALPSSSAGPLKADAPKFLAALREVAQTGSVLVLVDPYALAEKDDSGRVRSYAKEVHDLVAELSLDRVVVYCRNDEIHKPCLDALVALLKEKLEVRCGDFHDRYLLVGYEGKSKSPFVELSEPWHGVTAWKGVVFGASFNGVSKRPTYVLPFDAKDIPVVSKYLKGAAPSRRAL